jgi:putative colanic acid biosynthesis UDP-glucose lipid carrier transferase
MTSTLSTASAWAPTDRAEDRRALSRRVAVDIVGFFDVIGVLVGGLVPAVIYATRGDVALNVPAVVQSCLITALFCYLCLRHFGLYDVSRIHDLPADPIKVFGALALGFTAALGLGLPFLSTSAHFWVWYATWALMTATWVIGVRLIARHILSRLTAAGHFDARVAVYGSGRIAERLQQYLADPRHAVRLVGVYDDRRATAERAWPERHGKTASSVAVAGSIEDLIRHGRLGQFDRIVIALPPSADRRTADIARRLEQLPVSLHVVTHIASDLVDQGPAHAVSHIGPIGLLDVKTKPLSDWGGYVKTVEDYVIASLALVALAPVMALIALAIRLESSGPVLFRQRRHGLNRRVIQVLKFRTMTVMEDDAKVTQATADDVRVTRVGRFLRSTSLDELPQLWNVLRGEMSLIGPRPHALVHDDHFGELLEGYANRHQVKPGMTGWAQVNGFRGPTDTPEKMRGRVDHDLWYIDHWSLWLDLRILALTVLVGFRHKNAL